MTEAMSIKKKVIITVISLCLASIAILIFLAYWYQMHQLRAGLQDLAKSEQNLFYTMLASDAEGLARAHAGLDRLDPLMKPFAARNRDDLFSAARPLFEQMRKDNGITHMYFIEPDGKVLLRVHKPLEAGDYIRRGTFLKSQATKQVISGIELGLNFFSLRSVSPVYYQQQLIGFLEVAEEIDHVFSEMKRINGIDVSLFLTEEYVRSQRTHVAGERAGDFAVLYPTQKEVALRLATALQPQMKAALHAAKVTIVSLDGEKYAVGVAPIQDAGGATAGVLLSHRDVTSLFSRIWAGVAAFTVTLLIILLASLSLLYLSLRKSLALFNMLRDHISSITTSWDLSSRLGIDRRDEIGQLTEEFNVMTDRLHLLTRELEQRITDKEQMLIHQSRMAAMGEMIGCIAHQWRQPLNTLNLIVQEMPVYYKTGAFTEEYLAASTSLARELIAHMSQTINDFRNFFKPDKERVAFSLKDVLERTLKLMKADFKEHRVELEVVAEGDPTTEGYPNEYGQVILNILRNVSDAFQERSVETPKVVIRIYEENGRCVMVISDNAGGIPEEIIDQIFDPYFTTKDPEKGTGLGLYMSKTIIEKNMGGTLSVRNTAEGAEFEIAV